MPISPEDRAKWDRQVAALREAQLEAAPSPEYMAKIVEWANRSRAAHGIPPLRDRFADPPEVDFHERAVQLGLRRPRS